MLRHERLSGMLEFVARQGTVSIEDLVDAFGISAATARRDLDDLSAQQLITRTRGGAVAHAVTYDLPLRYKASKQSRQKRDIAAYAAGLAELNSVIGINGGTTNTEVAHELAARVDQGAGTELGSPALTVVTNALNIANELAVRPKIKIVVVGGVLRSQSFELIGPFAKQVLKGVSIDTMFLAVDGITVEGGLAAAHEGEAQINAMMVNRSRRVIVVADSSKLGKRAFCTICPLEKVDLLVTDRDAPPEIIAQFEAAGLAVQLA